MEAIALQCASSSVSAGEIETAAKALLIAQQIRLARNDLQRKFEMAEANFTSDDQDIGKVMAQLAGLDRYEQRALTRKHRVLRTLFATKNP